MKFLTAKNARLLGGAASAALAVTHVIPAQGESFKLPGFDGNAIWGFWVPIVVALANFMPGSIPKIGPLTGANIGGYGLLVLGGRRLIAGQFSPNLNNVAFTYTPVVTGFSLIAA